MEGIRIEKMGSDSWNDVLRIYRLGIETKNATFETKVPDWESWDKSHREDCRLIAKIANESLTTVKQREEASLKYYKALEKVEKLDQQRPAKKKKR